MRTKVPRRDGNAVSTQYQVDVFVDGIGSFETVIATTDPRLVRQNDERQAVGLHQLKTFDDAAFKFDLVGVG